MITDRETSQKLYETYFMKVYSFVMTLAGEKDLAEEITQETFYRAMTARQSFRGNSDEFTWLCAIAKNLFHDEMRRNARRSDAVIPEEIPDSSSGLGERAADKDDSFRIHLILHSLEEPYKGIGTQIYTRVGDTNTPKNEMASYNDVKQLWRIHFENENK